MKKVGLFAQVDKMAWRKSWSVNGKSVGYGERAFEYMADYLFRVGISNQRIIRCDEGRVTFWYKENKSKRRVVCKLAVDEFIDRFLMHVLPKGFVKIRYYGICAPGARAKLALVRELLAADDKVKRKAKSNQKDEAMIDGSNGSNDKWRPCCPQCKQPMILTGTIEKRARHPPG